LNCLSQRSKLHSELLFDLVGVTLVPSLVDPRMSNGDKIPLRELFTDEINNLPLVRAGSAEYFLIAVLSTDDCVPLVPSFRALHGENVGHRNIAHVYEQRSMSIRHLRIFAGRDNLPELGV